MTATTKDLQALAEAEFEKIDATIETMDERLQAIGGAISSGLEKIDAILEAQGKRIDRAEERIAEEEEAKRELKAWGSRPPGTVRFRSPSRNLRVVLETTAPLRIGHKFLPATIRSVAFENGIADVTEEIAAELREHPRFGRIDHPAGFFEDPEAKPIPSRVQVVEGARTTRQTVGWR